MEAYTVKRFIEWNRKFILGDMTAAGVREEWEAFKAGREQLKAEFGAMKKAELARFCGVRFANEKKSVMVEQSYHELCFRFVHDGAVSYGIGFGIEKSIEQGIDEKISKWTDAMISERATARKDRLEATQKAWVNPETLEEFNEFVRKHGRSGYDAAEKTKVLAMTPEDRNAYMDARGLSRLSAEQRTRYDELRAEQSRGVRAMKAAATAAVEPVAAPAGVTMVIRETTHTQKGHKVWVVQMSDRVEREKYLSFKERAQKLGGYYSAYSRDGAVPGFQFKSAEAAQQFTSMERIDGAQRLEERQEELQVNAAEKLNEAGERLVAKADESMSADRLVNTARRAQAAAEIERAARAEKLVGQTTIALSTALLEGRLKFLNKVAGYVKPVKMLEQLLRSAQSRHLHALNVSGAISYSEVENRWAGSPAPEDIESARFPWPWLHRRQVENQIEAGARLPGAKLLARRVEKVLERVDPGESSWQINDHHDAATVREFAKKFDAKGNYVLMAFDDYDQLLKLDIRDEVELRAALREFLTYRSDLVKPDPIREAERQLIGVPMPGFYPTPVSLGREVVDRAGIEEGMRVLEPSVGKGDLYEVVCEGCPGARVDAVEWNQSLYSILEAKNIPLVHKGDFLDFNPGPVYDRIVMNPPFEAGQDIAHVRHAYDLLAPGGRLVAIMSEGAFFHKDRQATEFQSWLSNSDGSSEKNEAGAFAGADAFRQTGVNTRLVVVEKQAQRVAQAESEALPKVVPVDAECEQEAVQQTLQLAM